MAHCILLLLVVFCVLLAFVVGRLQQHFLLGVVLLEWLGVEGVLLRDDDIVAYHILGQDQRYPIGEVVLVYHPSLGVLERRVLPFWVVLAV